MSQHPYDGDAAQPAEQRPQDTSYPAPRYPAPQYPAPQNPPPTYPHPQPWTAIRDAGSIPTQVSMRRVAQPSGVLAGFSIAAVVLLVATQVVRLALAPAAEARYERAAREGEPADLIFTAYEISALPWFLAAVVAWLFGAGWLLRVRRNAEVLSPRPHKRSPGWAWAGWIVPVVSLWFPYQVVRDVRRATQPRPGRALVGWWWGLFLAMTFTFGVGDVLVPVEGPVEPGAMAGTVWLAATGTLVVAAASALWVAVVVVVQREQAAASAQAAAARAQEGRAAATSAFSRG